MTLVKMILAGAGGKAPHSFYDRLRALNSKARQKYRANQTRQRPGKRGRTQGPAKQMADTEKILNRLDQLLDRLEPLLPPPPGQAPEFAGGAFQWRRLGQKGMFEKIDRPGRVRLADLQCVERQKRRIIRNTRQFLAGLPANNVLLWGPKGTGKSSLIKALLGEYQAQGLNLIEVERDQLSELKSIIQALVNEAGRFILYCDDLSFAVSDPDYKAIKVILDGSLSQTPENMLVYATSNRRHLVPESMQDNQRAQIIQGELHPGEASEEKTSLAERFGIWLAFHPFSQDQYLEIVDYWLDRLDFANRDAASARRAALRWALEHGSRSGRSAWQFARDWAGRHQLKAHS